MTKPNKTTERVIYHFKLDIPQDATIIKGVVRLPHLDEATLEVEFQTPNGVKKNVKIRANQDN